MVELLGAQNRKMVELLGVKFAQKGLFLKIFAAPSASRPILSFRTTLYIKFDHTLQVFSKFRHFRKIFSKMRNFFEIWTPETPQKSLLLHFRPLFSKKGRITRTYVEIGRLSPPPPLAITSPHSSILFLISFNVASFLLIAFCAPT